jgi:hypothetical protein
MTTHCAPTLVTVDFSPVTEKVILLCARHNEAQKIAQDCGFRLRHFS